MRTKFLTMSQNLKNSQGLKNPLQNIAHLLGRIIFFRRSQELWKTISQNLKIKKLIFYSFQNITLRRKEKGKEFEGRRRGMLTTVNGATQSATCWVGTGHERFEKGGSVLGRHPAMWPIKATHEIHGLIHTQWPNSS